MDLFKIDKPFNELIFAFCMGLHFELIKENTEVSDQFNLESFEDLLVRYEMKKFSSNLFKFQLGWKSAINDCFLIDLSDNQSYIKILKHKLKISKILKVLYDKKKSPIRNYVISFDDNIEKIDLDDNRIVEAFKDLMIKEFCGLNLNRNYGSFEDVPLYDKNSSTKYYLDFTTGNPNVDDIIKPYTLPINLLENGDAVFFTEGEITVDLIKNVILKLEEEISLKSKASGAKIRNYKIGDLAKRLSYLHLIEKFLNDTRIESIKDYPLSNNTCRFIYDYFEFWGLLEEHVLFDESNKEKRTNYIKSLIRNFNNYSESSIMQLTPLLGIRDNHLESRIDLFKRVKTGRISTDEYAFRIESFKYTI